MISPKVKSIAMIFSVVLCLILSGSMAQAPGRITSERHSGLCVDVKSSSREDDAPFLQFECNGDDSQKFTFKHIKDGFYQIRGVNSGKCMAVKDGSTSAGAAVVQLPCLTLNRLWRVTGSGNTRQIIAKHSQMCLNIRKASKEEEAELIQWPCGDSTVTNDKWRVDSELDSQAQSSPIKPPTKSPTKPPTKSPTKPPTKSPTKPPTKQAPNTPTQPSATSCSCMTRKKVPSQCEVQFLIELMEIAVSGQHRLAPQWLRLSFHDAGTFNKAVPEGGANGCLMNFPDMRRQDENGHLHLAINTLEKIRDDWEQLDTACIDISSADIIQFAGFFASVRQTGSVPGITSAKIIELLGFKWGRPDETNCKTKWTQNLPGFMLGADENDIPLRCKVAGQEIKTKMMDRNGFTSEEATALIGAHTIGLTRNVFGDKAAPWVVNGADNATPTGPVFDNSYFVLMEQNIPALSTAEFDSNTAPFKEVFPDWFQTASSTPLNFLDTDLVLAFPPKSSSDHPDYHAHTVAFTNNNQLFLTTFRKALVKMGSLGVTGVLTVPGPCSSCQAFTPVTVRSLLKLVSNLGEATSTAEFLLAAEQEANKDQLLAQTTVIRITS